MNKIKCAVIGLGKMGMSHAAILGAHPDVDVVGVCDTSSFLLNAFKKFSPMATFSDYEEMITSVHPDAVFVVTPTKFHFPIVKYALEKNIHVFCEKPFCLHSHEGEELVALAKSKKLVNQVGYHNQFIGTFRELKRLLQAKVLDEIVHFTGEAYGPVVTKEKGTVAFKKRRRRRMLKRLCVACVESHSGSD